LTLLEGINPHIDIEFKYTIVGVIVAHFAYKNAVAAASQ
jgi:hypothetical protein